MHEPILTWNLFLTAILVPGSVFFLGVYFNRVFKRRDQKDEEIKRLSVKIESEREQVIKDWRKSYTENLCSIKHTLNEINEKLTHKVSQEDCTRERKDLWDRIDKISQRIYETLC